MAKQVTEWKKIAADVLLIENWGLKYRKLETRQTLNNLKINNGISK